MLAYWSSIYLSRYLFIPKITHPPQVVMAELYASGSNSRFWFLLLNPFMAWVYQKNCLTPKKLAHHTHSGRKGMLWAPLFMEFQFKGLQRIASLHGSRPLEHYTSPPRGESHTTLLAFSKGLKNWLCQLAWGPSVGASFCRWLTD